MDLTIVSSFVSERRVTKLSTIQKENFVIGCFLSDYFRKNRCQRREELPDLVVVV